MMRSLLTLFGLLLMTLNSHAQPYHDNIWIFSDLNGARIVDFSSGEPRLDSIQTDLIFEGSSASICDAEGNLMFYTNGCRIYNWQHRQMENGAGINPGQVYDDFCPLSRERGYPIGTQSSWIIPWPKHPDEYLLLHMAIDYDDDPETAYNVAIERLYYTVVDMSTNDGEGLVTQKNVLIDSSYREPKAILNRHANGVDWWYVTPLGGTNTYQVYLIDSTGVNLHHEQNIGLTDNNSSIGGDQLVFNSSGNQLLRFSVRQNLSIYDFDRVTGQLSDFQLIDFPQSSPSVFAFGGVAISPSGQYAYVTFVTEVYQYDLWAEDIEASQLLIAELIDDGSMFLPPSIKNMQIGPDCKIYGYTNSGMNHHVIHHPDERGEACGWEQGGLPMGIYVFRDQPMFPNFRLGPLGNEGSPCAEPIVSNVFPDREEEQIKVFPNPANDVLFYTAEQAAVSSVGLYDGRGRLVRRQSGLVNAGATGRLDVHGLVSGLYVIRLRLASGREVARKVVVR